MLTSRVFALPSVRLTDSEKASPLHQWAHGKSPLPHGKGVVELTRGVVYPSKRNLGIYKWMMLLWVGARKVSFRDATALRRAALPLDSAAVSYRAERGVLEGPERSCQCFRGGLGRIGVAERTRRLQCAVPCPSPAGPTWVPARPP